MKTTRSTVLVVEDDHLIQLHARIALEDAGHEVLLADDGEDALAKAAMRGDITALFTDIGLPGAIDGIGVATAIHRTHPDTAIVVTSGLRTPAVESLPKGGAFMAKPYTAAQMCRALDRCVDA
jgi:DNA-binding NtrC family response regulator